MKRIIIILILSLLFLTACQKGPRILDCTDCYETVLISAWDDIPEEGWDSELPFDHVFTVTCEDYFAYNTPCYDDKIRELGLENKTLSIKEVEVLYSWCNCKEQ